MRLNQPQNRVMTMWTNYFSKMKGVGQNPFTVYSKDIIVTFTGTFLTIAGLIYLTQHLHSQWIMASLGGSCALAFGLWQAPVSQPHSIIAGHALSSMIALVMYHLAGNGAVIIGLAVALAVSVMMLTRTMHPPAAANPLVIMFEGSHHWEFLLFPVLTGALFVVVMALLINNLRQTRKYPTYW